MPISPKSPCPRCRHVRCTCSPDAKPAHNWGKGTTRERRPEYASSKERDRRRRTVLAWLAHNEVGRNAEGKPVAICPDCHQPRCDWVADHVKPLAQGGTEGGQLRVHCRSCSNRQGGRAGNAAKRKRGRA